MALKHNIVANYISQVYVAVIGVLILPLYVKHMGVEAYGLVGFFSMLQAWFTILDLGLTPTVGRETARFKAGGIDLVEYRRLFRALSLVFFAISMIGGLVLLLMAQSIAAQWLSFKVLGQQEVIFALQLMGVCVALRWMGGLYRGVVVGSERLVWLSAFNIIVATLRFAVVFITMYMYGFTPKVFFIHQLFVAIVEFLGLLIMARCLLPSLDRSANALGWSFAPVKPLLKFSLSIAFTSAVWVLVTQSDKLVLSGILPLAEYGHFTLAVLVAGGITVLSGPVSNALLPRMASLYAENKSAELILIYRKATRFVAALVGSASIVLALCAKPLLVVWTGDKELAEVAYPILALYAAGNGFLALGSFPYYLQYAKGNLKYHIAGCIITVSLLIPAIIFSAINYGGVGAGWAWLFINAIFFFFWVTYVHYKLEPGLHWEWLIIDCLKVLLPTLLSVWFVVDNICFSTERWLALVQIIGIAVFALFVSFVSSRFFKSNNVSLKK
ncbi:oligosaccharide flippase family protein [Pseudomonas monteilii]|uniref:Polysaccharide biosynthesis protein n=1 Tax=Pseudomonas monteilii TaxID=76759 RepID=A0A2N1IYR1_9PSED|nr:oligosaccharide flippase family protein [Pseudomonas monteilii]PKI25877.1 polysaccharide biosynthesis protein [Pseudomonas monteilii]